MRKKKSKAFCAFIATAAACTCAYKASISSYTQNTPEEDLLIAENALALSEDSKYDIPWKALGEESCTIKKINGDVSITIDGVTIAPHASYEVDGTKKDCSFWPFATCNPDAITLCHEIK